MSKKLEKYTGTKTYMFPNGALATPETVQAQFSAISHFTHVVETDERGEVMFALQNLSAMRSMYGIDNTLPEAEAIAAMEVVINTPPPVIDPDAVTVEERTAAALEMIAINGMPDVI